MFIDIGHDVQIEQRFLDGKLGGVAYKHKRPGQRLAVRGVCPLRS